MNLGKLVLLTMLSCNALSFAVVVKMPEAAIINQNLRNFGLQYFAEKTHIAEQLANEEFEAVGVAMLINTNLSDYHEAVEASGLLAPQLSSSRVFKALLQHNQEALEELAECGLYQP